MHKTHPVLFNIEVRFLEEVFKRSSISERDALYPERVVNLHPKFQFVVNNGDQAV